MLGMVSPRTALSLTACPDRGCSPCRRPLPRRLLRRATRVRRCRTPPDPSSRRSRPRPCAPPMPLACERACRPWTPTSACCASRCSRPARWRRPSPCTTRTSSRCCVPAGSAWSARTSPSATRRRPRRRPGLDGLARAPRQHPQPWLPARGRGAPAERRRDGGTPRRCSADAEPGRWRRGAAEGRWPASLDRGWWRHGPADQLHHPGGARSRCVAQVLRRRPGLGAVPRAGRRGADVRGRRQADPLAVGRRCVHRPRSGRRPAGESRRSRSHTTSRRPRASTACWTMPGRPAPRR